MFKLGLSLIVSFLLIVLCFTLVGSINIRYKELPTVVLSTESGDYKICTRVVPWETDYFSNHFYYDIYAPNKAKAKVSFLTKTDSLWVCIKEMATFETVKVLNVTNLARKGASITQNAGIDFIAPDSILLVIEGQFFLIDSSGNVLYAYKPSKYIELFADYYLPPSYYKGKLKIACRRGCDTEPYDLHNANIEGYYDLGDGTYEPINFRYSNIYADKHYGAFDYSYRTDVSNEKWIYSFPPDPNIYVYDDGTITSYGCKSRHQTKDIQSMPYGPDYEGKKTEMLRVKASEYQRMVYGSSNDRFYRMFFQSNNSIEKYVDKSVFLMVLNSKFEVLDEIELPSMKKANYWFVYADESGFNFIGNDNQADSITLYTLSNSCHTCL